MNQKQFARSILDHLQRSPTTGQQTLAELLAEFIFSRQENQRYPVFVLKGYAGTGKTSMVGSLVKSLPLLGRKTVLLAPTGRAAKVLSLYSEQQAFTVHRKIYAHQAVPGGGISISLRTNLHKHTLFIVDEASMIQSEAAGNDAILSSRNLLDDLIEYVYSSNCRLLLTGDTAQLPPVGLNISPALDIRFLNATYPLQLTSFELTEVVRQEKESGVLFNATMIREKLKLGSYKPPIFQLKSFDDIIRINGNELGDALNLSIHSKGVESTVVVTRSNKRANLFNKQIRNRILFRDPEVAAGDIMMVVKNNYFWLPPESQAGFIANGDTIEILRVRKTEDLYGFRFTNVHARLVDYPDEPELELKIILNTIDSESAALTQVESKKLFGEVMLDYEAIPSNAERFKQLRSNPYYNALQVKFAYALTCHKTQGGQWEDVFVDQGYLPDDGINSEYLRWLYTALTRAVKRVYLVNFNDKLFGG